MLIISGNHLSCILQFSCSDLGVCAFCDFVFCRPKGDMTDIDRISILTISIFFINSILTSSKFLLKLMLTFPTTKICQYIDTNIVEICVNTNIVRSICEVDYKWCPRLLLLTTATDHGWPCEVKLPNFGLILFDNVVPI